MSIKTRESLRTIKTVGSKVKGGAKEVKEKAEEFQNTGYESSDEYAGNKVEKSEVLTGDAAVRATAKIGNWGVKQTTNNIRNRKARQYKVKVEEPMKLNPPKRQMLNAPSNTVKQKAKKQAAKAAKKSAKEIARATKSVIKKVIAATKAAVKATVAAIKGIVSAIAAGGWVAVVVVLLLCIVGMVLGFVSGISVKDNLENEDTTLVWIVKNVEKDFYETIEDNKKKYEYDICRQTDQVSNTKLIVALYVVIISEQDEIMPFNKENEKELRKIYNDIYEVSYKVRNEIEDNIEKQILYVKIHEKNRQELIEHFHLSKKQIDLLDWIISEQ